MKTEPSSSPRTMVDAALEKLLSEDPAVIIRRTRTAFDDLKSPFGDSFVLFGAGNLGGRTLAGLRKLGIEPIAFSDNNKELWNRELHGLPIVPPADAVARYGGKSVFIATTWNPSVGHPVDQLRVQLSAFGPVKVISFAFLYWKYPDIFLPHFCLDVPLKVREEAQLIRACSALWADAASRVEFVAQIRWRLWLDFCGLPSPVGQKQYFPDDLFQLSSDEVFIDCGAFDGDTIHDFIGKRGHSFSAIVAFEPDPINYARLLDYVSGLDKVTREKIEIRRAAVGDIMGTVSFQADAALQSSVSRSGKLVVDSIALDRYISMAPTYIKMDVEGAEPEVLSGAKAMIQRYSPILAISVYHRPDHLWKLPLFVRSLSDKYRFYLRPHKYAAWDVICYAVPESRLTAP